MCRVVNRKVEKEDVYIGRGSKWGNKFKIGVDGNREEVIEKYRVWLWEEMKSGRISDEELMELNGKKLGCFCKPLACHGDVLVKAVEYVKGLRIIESEELKALGENVAQTFKKGLEE